MLIRCVWHPLLPYFLEGANNLEVLTLGQGDDDLDFNASTEPEHVPRCLSSCLRAISVENFRSQETEFEMLKFFLKNGKVLKTLEISSPRQIDKREKDSILEKISEFPEHPRRVRLQFAEISSRLCKRI
ncbi:hypothetical protein ACH5RR_037677 [Cinchona calisaya]|uniref:FBD domain-containing protein n=1 Tax=Cinchona calisaya TaxID=153742 RepID=A0ABD2Y871_9GENT